MRVSGAVVVLVTDRRVVVRPVVIAVGALVGAGVAAETAAGWSGALDECRFSLAKIVMPPKLLNVIPAASARRSSVDAISGLARRGRFVMLTRGTSARRGSMRTA